MDLESVAIKLSRSENLPALPNVVTAVLKLADDGNMSPKAMERALEKDTGLAAKLLRVANSSYYGGYQVPSIGRAISVLGLSTVKNLVLALSMQSMTSSTSQAHRLNKVAYWQHSLASAISARILAKLIMPSCAEELYLAAMMHDIGVIVMERFMPNELDFAITSAEKEGIPLHEAEQKLLGFDHAAVGGLLAERWGFDSTIHSAIRYHHNPIEDPEGLESTYLIVAADVLAHQCGYSTIRPNRDKMPQLDDFTRSIVNLPDDQLDVIRSVIVQEVRRAQEGLNIKAA